MTNVIPVVFLSSRFAEFRPIRDRVKTLLRGASAVTCKVVDLDENYPDHDPPWIISQDAVRAADIMILLVGRSYGTVPPGQIHSYLHLEYQATCSRGSKTAVLPYFFDDAPECEDAGVRSLCEEVARRHTFSRMSLMRDVQEIAFEIVQHVQRKAFSLISAASGAADIGIGVDEVDEDGYPDDTVEEDRRIENDPHLSLEPKHFEKWSNAELLVSPARTAAAEQRREAARSLGLGEWRRAMWHLDQARQRQPWDLPTLFWGARLKLISGRRDESRQALAIAVRAARVAEKELQNASAVPVAAAYMLAARAASQLEDPTSGVEFAQRAVAIASRYWFTHYELARQHAYCGDGRSAAAALRSSFFLRPTIWQMVANDAAFARCRKQCDDERRKIYQETRSDVGKILQNEADLWARIAALGNGNPIIVSELEQGWVADSATELSSHIAAVEYVVLPRVLDQAKRSFTRQVDALRKLAKLAVLMESALPKKVSLKDKAWTAYSSAKQDLEGKLARAAKEQWDEKFDMDSNTMVIGGAIAFLSGWVAIDAWQWWGAFVPAALVIASWVAALLVGFEITKTEFEADRKARISSLKLQLEAAEKKRTTEWAPAYAECRRVERALRETLELFVEGVEKMETACLKRRIYCPTPPLDRAKLGDMVQLKRGDHGEEYVLEDELLPESLAEWWMSFAEAKKEGCVQGSVLAPDKHLYRLASATEKLASRKRCYFDR